MGFLTKRLSIEFNTSVIRIVRDGKHLLTERTSIAVDDSGNVVAFGNEVYESEHKIIINPVRNDVIADFNGFEQLLRFVFKKALGKSSSVFTPSLIVLCLITDSSSEVEIRSVRDALEHAGARNVYMMYLSSAIMEGIGIGGNDPFLLLDAGVGKIGFTLFSGKRPIHSSKLDFGIIKIRQIIALNIKEFYRLNCSEEIVDDIIYNYLTVNEKSKVDTCRISGLNENGDSTSCELDISILNRLIQPYFELIIHEIQLLLESYSKKIENSPKYICIGGEFSRLNGFEDRLSKITGLNVMNKSDTDYLLKGLLLLDKNFETNKNAIR